MRPECEATRAYVGRMRILVVTPWFPTSASRESGIFVEREAAALAEAHDVRVLHLDWNQRGADAVNTEGVTVDHVELHRARLGDCRRARAVVRDAAVHADVVHTHALPGLLPWTAGRPSPRPWVHSEHWSGLTAPQTLSVPERLVGRVLSPVLDRPDVVVAESGRLAEAVRRHRRGATQIVPCVVPAVEVAPAPPRTGAVRIVAVGGLIERKGPAIAVRAISVLRRAGLNATLTWVGSGPLRPELDGLVAEEGLVDAVTFTGSLDSVGVSAHLDDAHLFLLPTQGDNFCVVVAEALMHGRPIVSGAATGAVDYVDLRYGQFVTGTDPAAYADAVRALLARTDDTASDAIAATVRDRFAPATVRAGLEAVYRSAGVRVD